MKNCKPSPNQPDARVILCETGRKWATVLRRELGTTRLYEVRSDDDLFSELAASPLSLLVRETTPQNVRSALELADHIGRDFSHASIAAVGTSELLPYRTILWEAGFTRVCASLRKTAPIAKLAFAQLAAGRTSNRTVRETIFDQMPWARFATSENS